MASVLGAGLIAIDHMFLVPAKSLRRANPEFLGSSGGGSVGNTLCMLRLLGHQTAAFGVVGNDAGGSLVRSDLQAFGVGASLLLSRGHIGDLRQTRQFSHVIYSDGRHAFRKSCLACGTPFRREIQLGSEDVTDAVLRVSRGSGVVHLDRANEATLRLAKECKKADGRISFDYAFEAREGGSRWSEEILKLADLVKVSETVFSRRMGSSSAEAIREWQRRFPNISYLLVSRSERGVSGYGQTQSGRLHFDRPAIRCDHYRDGAGAGDVLIAVAISEFILRNRVPEHSGELEHGIDLCQALAALGCTMYGARSLQRVFLSQKLSSQRIRETAEAIVQAREAGNSISPRIGLPPRLSQPYRFAPGASCTVCGFSQRRRLSSRAAHRNTLYVEELSKGPNAMNHAFTVGEARVEELRGLKNLPAMFVGSGGSFVAATFGEQLALRAIGLPAKAMTPFEFERIPSIGKSTGVWLLSYGGENPDILAAARHVADLKIDDCAVVTGTQGSKLAGFARDHDWPIVSLLPQARGFVATVGMLAMISALGGILSPEQEKKDLEEFFDQNNLYSTFGSADRLANEKASKFPDQMEPLHLVTLGSGWGWPAVVDFESKIVEGGICTVEISELKNYTHGRYINAFYHRRNRHFVLFRTPEDAELVGFIRDRLKRYFDVTVLATMHRDTAGALELLVSELFLASYLGKKVGRDLSRPKYPREAKGLYGWRPSARQDAPTGFTRGDLLG